MPTAALIHHGDTVRKVANSAGFVALQHSPLAQLSSSVWELGSVKMDMVKLVREAAHQAIARLARSGLPHAKTISDRVDGELSTMARAPASAPARPR